jgi:NhaA family Na+:H+ antiporter
VLVAMVIPANAKISANVFCAEGLTLFDRIRHTCQDKEACSILTEKDYQESVQDIESLCEAAQAPLQQLEHTLNPWVSYLIMPLFALANAGVTLQWGAISELVWHPITVGIVLGLIIGKQIGITLFSWLSVKLNLATLPTGLSWRHIYGVSWLGGIGFTMSLFIANLAFTDPLWVDTAKVGILLASTLSGLLGYLVLNQILKAGAPAPKTVSP